MEHIELIRRMSRDNPAWGEDRIADELRLKCGIKHSPSTIRRYMVRLRNPDQGQSWRTFVKNHLGQIFACDLLVQHTAFFKAYYVFAVMELDRRRIVHFNITDHPSLSWVKQQIRQATWDQIPRFLIHDNDGIFGLHRLTIVNEQTGRTRSYRCTLDAWLKEVMGITGVPTPYAAPNANAHIERWFLSLRVEALNHFIFTSQEHIRRVVTEYVDYYNRLRPSQAIHAIPDPDPELRQPPSSSGRLVVRPILRGLHHDYRMVA